MVVVVELVRVPKLRGENYLPVTGPTPNCNEILFLFLFQEIKINKIKTTLYFQKTFFPPEMNVKRRENIVSFIYRS